jgi:hypothetical protein
MAHIHAPVTGRPNAMRPTGASGQHDSAERFLQRLGGMELDYK